MRAPTPAATEARDPLDDERRGSVSWASTVKEVTPPMSQHPRRPRLPRQPLAPAFADDLPRDRDDADRHEPIRTPLALRPTRLPDPRWADDAGHECVARCVLGLTAYTRHDTHTAARSAGDLLASFLARVGSRPRWWLLTSTQSHWIELRACELDDVVRGLQHDRPARHLFALRLADAVDAPEHFFAWREVDPSRGNGYLQLGFAPRQGAAALFDLAAQARDTLPMWWGAAGYLVSEHPSAHCTSLDAAWVWRARYPGLDVHDLDVARRIAHRGVASTNWITLLGRPLLDARGIDAHALARTVRDAGCEWTAGDCAAMVRASAWPSSGDRHALTLDDGYHAAAHALRDLYAPEAPRMAGPFWYGARSRAWARRFLGDEVDAS